MKFTSVAGAIIGAVVVAGCSADSTSGEGNPGHTDKAGHAAWSYQGENGPENWGTLSPEYTLCATGKMQSPIDLGAGNASANVSVVAKYQPSPLTISNNGHTVQADFAAGSSLISGDAAFNLVQVHFHTPSEATLNGKAFPMVAHFVHGDDAGNLAVLGVMFEQGAANAELQKIIDAAPKQKTAAASVDGVTLSPAKMLPDDMSVYRYQGSLTTPPCSEGVRWHIAKTPVTASAEQLAAMAQIMGNNARPVQPLNGRLLVAPDE